MISIILPVHNEEQNIEIVCDMIFDIMNSIDREFEVVFVDDGSTDSSLSELERAAGKHPITIVELTRNYGQTAAIMAGIDQSAGDIIILMDADGQNDPNDIPVLLAKLNEGYDVVSGWRQNRQDSQFRRNIPSRLANGLISHISGVHLHDTGCTLKAYRRSSIRNLRLYGEMHRLIPVYAAQEGARIAECVVTHHPRHAGRSKYGGGRVFKVVMDFFVSQFLAHYQTRPMYVFGAAASTLLVLAIMSGAYAVVLKFAAGVSFIQTPLPLLVIFLVSTSIICFLIGFVAELLMRTYFESQDRRPYVIRSVAPPSCSGGGPS